MIDYIKMDFYRMRKQKTFWIFAIIVFAVTFIIPIIVRLFLNMMYDMTQSIPMEGIEDSSLEISQETIIPKDIPFSSLLRAPFGAITALIIFSLVFAANFFHADIGNGYIKNLAGRAAKIGRLAISKFIVVFVEIVFIFISALIGTILGNLIAYGISFDADIGMGILELLTKLLMAWAMASEVLFFAAGLRVKALAIVFAVFLGTGMFSLIIAPINFGIQQLSKNYDFQLNKFFPDQLFVITDMQAADINLLYGVISSAVLIVVCVFFTYLIANKKDI